VAFRPLRRSHIRRHAWLLFVVTACATEAPVSPTLSRPSSAALASRQGTTGSTILFNGQVPTLAGNSLDHVFAINDDGTGIRQLTTSRSLYGSWAPDGKHILFSKLVADAFVISIMNVDGTGIIDLTSPPTECADVRPRAFGKQVVFIRAGGACPDYGLFLMNPDGTSRALLDASATSNSNLAPSPKGGRIAYQRFDGDIWIKDVATGGLTNLTKGAGGFNPSFSPSGKQIAFVRGLSVYVMNDDGTGITQLTSPPLGFLDDFPQWSPDGKSIGFTRYEPGAEETNVVADIIVMNADGSGVLKNLTGQSLGAGHTAFVSAWAR
jgi:Tol biopolymer transport system component